MTSLTFYHQVRVDGGKRTGIDYNDVALLQVFEDEAEEADPTLLWFVDIRCQGEGLPEDAEGARNWFLKNSSFFIEQLRLVASHLVVGFDAGLHPFQFEMEKVPSGAEGEIVVSSVRRLAAREIAKNINDLADQWNGLIARLAPLSIA